MLDPWKNGIMKDKQQLKLLRKVAQSRGLIVFTDSDGAGFVIRNHIKSAIPGKYLKHAYIPDIFGKEKRKTEPSKEGKIGVEGVSEEIIMQALANAGVLYENAVEPERPITKIDLYNFGFTGGESSAVKRAALLKFYGLPERLTTNSLVKVLNCITTYDRFEADVSEIEKGWKY